LTFFFVDVLLIVAPFLSFP